MKKNQAFTLVELIIVLSVFSVVALFFWQILNSSLEDSSTLTDKVEVQNSVTSLMNILQQDIQEALPIIIGGEKNIFVKISDNTETKTESEELVRYYIINGNDKFIKYEFYQNDKNVKRTIVELDNSLNITNELEEGAYNNIVEFKMARDELGANIEIIGGKKTLSETDKSRYSLKSSYYTRNTM